ncbi:MAG TPA: hypothetical protein VK689_18620 [Armatimonadota bacterium]|nr:hypothetical protein [Armatimonadota bacterium]
MITPADWKPGYTERAQEFWAAYQTAHDTSALVGHTAGVDPASGRVWIGETAEDVLDQLEMEGVETPLYFIRIGFDHYFRKGGRR